MTYVGKINTCNIREYLWNCSLVTDSIKNSCDESYLKSSP